MLITIVASYGYVKTCSFEENLSVTSKLFITRFIERVVSFIIGSYCISYWAFFDKKNTMIHWNQINLIIKEYHAILENLNEVIITKTKDNCLKYFNSLGYKILNSGVELTNDEEKEKEILSNAKNCIDE